MTAAPADVHELFRDAFEHAPVGMAVVTRNSHRVVHANPAMADLLGLTPAELVGRPIHDFRVTHDREAELPTFAGERACRRSDGTTIWLSVHSSALPDLPPLPGQPTMPGLSVGPVPEDEAHEPLCLIHAVDISRRRAAEAERERRQASATALGEIRLAVLLGSAPERSLALLCRRARMLLAATDAVVIVPSSAGQARITAADGHDAAPLVDVRLPADGSLAAHVLSAGRAVVTGPDGEPHAVIEGRLPAEGRAEVLALPLRTPEVVLGVLCLVRRSGHVFQRGDIDVARAFADQAAAALHIGELRADRERLRVLEDRERIAMDLHDSVIQDLFAAGMSLGAVQPMITSTVAAERVASTVNLLDATIKQIRSTIFELETSDPGSGALDLIRRAVAGRHDQLGFASTLNATGDLDVLTAEEIDHLAGVISEALSNVARHAGASEVRVSIEVTPSGGISLVVRDDGCGFDPVRVPHGSGLGNMFRRAEILGAELRIVGSAGAGTRLELFRREPPRT